MFLAAVLTLTFVIGANTAVFSSLDAVVLRPLSIEHPEEMVELSTRIATSEADPVFDGDAFSTAMFEELLRGQHSFSELFAMYRIGVAAVQLGGGHQGAEVLAVSGSYYTGLHGHAAIGQLIRPDDVRLQAGQSAAIAVLSYRAWQAWTGADPFVVRKRIYIQGAPFLIAGVEDKSFRGMINDGSADVTIPLFSQPQKTAAMNLRQRTILWLRVFGRLHSGTTLESAQAAITTLWPHVQEAAKPPGYETGARAQRYNSRRIAVHSAVTGLSDLRHSYAYPLRILQWMALGAIVTACLNLANIYLADAAKRRSEWGVKAALGARLSVLLQEPVLQSLCLAVLGSIGGLAVASFASKVLLQLASTGITPSHLQVGIDSRTLCFTAGTTLAVVFLTSLTPAWFAAKTDPIDALQSQTRSIHSGTGLFGRALLTGQIAMSFVLLLTALLLVNTLYELQHQNPGYQTNNLLSVPLYPQESAVNAGASQSYFGSLATALEQTPGISTVSYAMDGPAATQPLTEVAAASAASTPVPTVYDLVGPHFFATVRMRMLSGREFDVNDAGSDNRVIISESLSRRFFGRADAVGRTIYLGPQAYRQAVQVIGVVNSASLWRVDRREPLAVYHPYLRPFEDIPHLHLLVRTAGDPAAMANTIGRVVLSFGRDVPLQPEPVAEKLSRSLNTQRMTAYLGLFFGLAALALVAVGIYGSLAFHVARRSAELSIRAMLGAARADLLRLLLRDVAVMTLLGSGIGVGASFLTGRLLKHLLFGTTENNPVYIVATLLFLLVVAGIAGLLPARRALHPDNTQRLREL